MVLVNATPQLRLTRTDSVLFEGTICHETTIFSAFAVFHWRAEGQSEVFQTLLLPDQMTVDEFRRIRVWLRWGITKNEKHYV